MKVDAFDFELPGQLIAQRPVSPRDAARLLHIGNGLHDHVMGDLADLLGVGDILVFNDTRVIPARLTGRRNDARAEVTLIKRQTPDTWRALARPARKLRIGDRVDFAPGFWCRVTAKGQGKDKGGEVTLTFNKGGGDLKAALDQYGAMPLPPYIKRDGGTDERDKEDYQTMFAQKDGAVAAPTAALHFTPALMAALERRAIGKTFLTLHVGAGTFLPVKAADTEDHVMHPEWGAISEPAAEEINSARQRGGKVVAVGTTSLRLLEAAASDDGEVQAFEGETDIFITPGYRFRAADMLVTNFHLPRSTLFMLVAAFSGLDTMKRAYGHAKEKGYRFYSYGDACLLERRTP